MKWAQLSKMKSVNRSRLSTILFITQTGMSQNVASFGRFLRCLQLWSTYIYAESCILTHANFKTMENTQA